jgi:2-polyprenyl-3-methyl-5-hydroxy-6-metoxy-1,4-benzoquinol methylase
MITKRIAKSVYEEITHFWGALSRRYYFEDYIRVYPDEIAFNRFGLRKKISNIERNNFLNHCKFYRFAGQFVSGAVVADVGCGSGYGCELLKDSGAGQVFGADISGPALRFARRRFGSIAEFSQQGITDLNRFTDGQFDVTICSEVLEHIKEYNLTDRAVAELKRITRPGGLLIIGTPNSELLGDHGFSFAEIRHLFSSHFKDFIIFENAFIPTGPGKAQWEERLRRGETGIIITQMIQMEESVISNETTVEIKSGVEPGQYPFGSLSVNTTLLHNTHSWIVIARMND